MDNVGIVVESLDGAIAFFTELGLDARRASHDRRRVVRASHGGCRGQRVEITMLRMPNGEGQIELSRFLTPPTVADHRNDPVNALGYLRVMFAVDDLDDTLARLRKHGAASRRRSRPVRRRVSALLRPRPGGNAHRVGRADQLTPTVARHYLRSRRGLPKPSLGWRLGASTRRCRPSARQAGNR